MIYGFDFDGTLVESWTAKPLPGVRGRLAALPAGTHTFIATNQAGPVFRAVLGQATYPSVEDVAQRLTDGLRALDWRPDLLLICVAPPLKHQQDYAWVRAASEAITALNVTIPGLIVRIGRDPTWRKPQPGMLFAAARYYDMRIRSMCYIGDMETDRQAARATGCGYLDAVAWRKGAAT